MSTRLEELLNENKLHELIKEAYMYGFQDGASHGNVAWKYPPHDIAFLMYSHSGAYPLGSRDLTNDELRSIDDWEDMSYDERRRLLERQPENLSDIL